MKSKLHHKSTLSAYIQAVRPHQWFKNVLVFLPAIGAHQFDVHTWLTLAEVFVVYSACASATYIFNDMRDIENDRQHPTKKQRPLVSGRISMRSGALFACILLCLSFGLAAAISIQVVGILLVYIATTTAYTAYLKRKVAIDVIILACLYTLRVLAGSFATGIMVSSWLTGFCIFLFFSLAVIKRITELEMYSRENTPKVAGRGYFLHDLPILEMMAVTSGYLSVLVLALYIESPAILRLYRHPEYLWGVSVILLYWFSRVLVITHRGGMHDDPVAFAIKDKVSLVCAACVFLIMLAAT